MKYSKSERAYFRNSKKENSIKGGTLRINGKLEYTDFIGKNGNNVVPKQKFKVEENNNMGFELQNMNPNNVGKYKPTNSRKPIKLMVQKGTGKIFIFFGYSPETQTYHLVCYINPDASKINNNRIICKKLVIHENGSSEIVKLSHRDFLNIGIEELIILCYHFLKIRQKNNGFMNELFEYLSLFIFNKVLGTRFPNSNNHRMYKDMVEEIGEMIIDEGYIILNQQNGGKLDIDGKLDSRDFMINNIESKPEIVRRNNTHAGIQLQEINNRKESRIPPKRRTTHSATNITAQQNFQNHPTVFPKEIIKKGFPFTNEPYIFFGYDTSMKKYRYVCYNSLTKTPIFRKLEDNREISNELTLDEIGKINKIELSILYCFLNKKSTDRRNGTQYMERLQKFLWNNFRSKIMCSDEFIESLDSPLKEYIRECFTH
jgi:hypothetical protein